MIYKLLVENMKSCRWRKPTIPPNQLEIRIAKCWSLEEGIMEIDNSNLLVRKRTQWKPPRENWVKLNFDDVARKEGSTDGGIVRENEGTMLLAYTRHLGKVSNYIAEAMALFRGLKW